MHCEIYQLWNDEHYVFNFGVMVLWFLWGCCNMVEWIKRLEKVAFTTVGKQVSYIEKTYEVAWRMQQNNFKSFIHILSPHIQQSRTNMESNFINVTVLQ